VIKERADAVTAGCTEVYDWESYGVKDEENVSNSFPKGALNRKLPKELVTPVKLSPSIDSGFIV